MANWQKSVHYLPLLEQDLEDDFDVSKARYHKLIIMTDADVDGAHESDITVNFYSIAICDQLLTHGYVYIAQPAAICRV